MAAGAVLALSLLAVAAAPPTDPPTPGFEEGDVPAPDATSAPKSALRVVPPLPEGPPSTGAIPTALLEAALAARDLPLAQRMRAISEPMLGRPYAIDPLGEGFGIDPDPLARYDAYDCLTFVEEVLALALSGDPSHSAEVRQRLRYGDAPVDYAHRRHFMELQWLPGNVADGFLVDTTARYAPTVRQEREVTLGTWTSWRRRRLFALSDEQLPVGTMALDVIPLDAAIAIADDIAPGSLVLTVRTDRNGVPIWTTHLGFVVEGERAQMRNASRRTAMRVLDEGLAWYLEHLKGYGNWPVAGISVFEPVEQGPRRGAILAGAP